MSPRFHFHYEERSSRLYSPTCAFRTRTSSRFLELYLAGTKLPVLLRDTTTLARVDHAVFVPEAQLRLLAERMGEGGASESVARYFTYNSTDAFLTLLSDQFAGLIDQCLAIEALPVETNAATSLALRLQAAGLLSDARIEVLWESCARSHPKPVGPVRRPWPRASLPART
jgi:hypothetical protein